MSLSEGCLRWQSSYLQPGVAAQDAACGFLQKADQTITLWLSVSSQEFLSCKNEGLKKNYILGSSLVQLWTKGQQSIPKREQCSATISHALSSPVFALLSHLKKVMVRSLSESQGYKQATVGSYSHPKYQWLN